MNKFFTNHTKQKQTKLYSTLILSWFMIMLSACQRNVLPIEASPALATVTRGKIEQTLTLVGYLEANQSSTLNWKTAGVVSSVSVSEGQFVKKGEVLASLEPNSLSGEILANGKEILDTDEKISELLVSETAKAKAYKELRDKAVALSDAEHHLESLSYPINDKERLEKAEQDMNEAKRLYDLAASDYQSVVLRDSLDTEKKEKYKILQDTLKEYARKNDLWLSYVSSPTKNQTDQACAAVDVAKAAYANALETFKTYQASFVRAQDLYDLEMKLENAQTISNRQFLAADQDGVVTSLNFSKGEYITPKTEAIRIDDLSSFSIAVDIAEYDINKLKDNPRIEIRFDAVPEKVYQGKIIRVADKGTSTGSLVSFRTVISVIKPDSQLKPGMTAQVKIVVRDAKNALMIPSSAYQLEQGTAYVDLVKNGQVEHLPVELGINDGKNVEVFSEKLAEGDTVKIQSN